MMHKSLSGEIIIMHHASAWLTFLFLTEDFFMYISFKYINNIFNLKLWQIFIARHNFGFTYLSDSSENQLKLSFDIKLLFIISIEFHS